MEKDFYEVLGVARSASADDIKKAYRKKAMKLHPDRNKGKDTQEQFKEAQKAYDVLSDDKKRQAYDQFGHDGVNASMGQGSQNYSDFDDAFSDIFSDFFGQNRRTRGPQRGSDLQYDLNLSLEEAFHGKEVKIRLPEAIVCSTCAGSGAKKGSSPKTCSTCNGNGQVRIQQGFINIQQTCPHCRGQGKIIKDPCNKCGGTGSETKHKTLSIKIPAGIDDNGRIRLVGKGEMGERGSPNGDLYVCVHINQHPIFKRNGDDLYCDAPIDIVTAALGGELSVPTLEGRLKLKIPAGTQSGKSFRLRGKGITSIQRAVQGDLYCRVVVETPVNLSEEQRELINKLGQSMGLDSDKHSPRQKSWVDSVKDFFCFKGDGV